MAEKTCVVTGASRGIGLATALRLARAGHALVIAARHEDALRQARDQIRAAGADCLAIAADVGQAEGCAQVIDGAVRQFGRIDVLVNNAGIAVLKPVDQTALAEFEAMVAANVRAVFCTTRAVWPILRRQGGGIIVNVSSVASVDPFRGFSVYGACKAWVNLFTQAVADEGRKLGIRVYAVAPGAVETQMLRQAFPDLPAEHVLAPDAVAATIEALCDERMACSTGQVIFVRK